MDPAIASIICSLLTLIGVIATVIAGNRKTDQQLKISQAVTDTKLEDLTREVRAHNDFARRVPVIEEQIKVANHRIDDLEAWQKKGA